MQETTVRSSVASTEKINVDPNFPQIVKRKNFWSQRLASVILSLVTLLVGLSNGWSSPYMAKLSYSESTDGIPRATDDELTWIASLLNIGRIFGAVFGALAQDIVGRKMSLFGSGLPMMCGWICLAFADNVPWLYASRALCGISAGMVWSTMTHYVAEIADPEIRGSLVLWNIAVHAIGVFVGNAVGPYISMQLYAYIAIFINLMFLVSFALMPDSPYRHIMMGNLDKAEAALKWFRRSNDVKSELTELQDYVLSSKVTFKQRLIELKQPHYAKSFLLLFLMNVFSYFTAINVVLFYAEIILTQSQVTVNPSTVVSATGLCCLVAALLATFLVDRFGRRRLLMASSFGMAVALSLLGLHFKLLDLGYDPATLTWLPCACLLLITFSFNAGVSCVPTAIAGELFSPALKSIASLGFSGTYAIFSSLSVGTFLPLVNLIGSTYVYWFYASGSYVSVVYYYYCLPETTGKKLQDIQKVPKQEENVTK